MALTQNAEIIEDMFPFDQASATPDKLRKVFRSGAYRGTTAAMADGYTQGNLAIIPEKYALDFARFCQRNPQPCPMIGVSDTGNPQMFTLGDDIDIRTDIPSYNIYRNGKFDGSVADSDQAIILDQVLNGVASRMATLYLLCGGKSNVGDN